MATDTNTELEAIFDNASEWPDFDGYERLKEEAREIRVLDVYRNESDVACEIRHVSLDDNPHYCALSYCWGAPVPKTALKPLQINGQTIYIRPTLYNFLHSIILHFDRISVWLDVICINQKDAQERANQVLLMSSIYASASSVLAWLGLSDDDTNYVFNNVSSVARKVATARDRRLFLEYVELFFLRPYWTRRWVVQEFALGEPIHLMCGSNIMTWPSLVDALSTYTSLPEGDAWPRYEAFKRLKNQRGPAKEGIVRLLIRFQKWRNVDPRDTVFALCSLAPDSSFLTISYERPAADLFFDIAAHILADGPGLDQYVVALRKSVSFSTSDLICCLSTSKQRYHEIGCHFETISISTTNVVSLNLAHLGPNIQYPAFAHCYRNVGNVRSPRKGYEWREVLCSHECSRYPTNYHTSNEGESGVEVVVCDFPFQKDFGLVFSIQQPHGHPTAICLKHTDVDGKRICDWLAQGTGVEEWRVLQRLCINGIVLCKRDHRAKARLHVTSLVLTLIWLWSRHELRLFWRILSELPAGVADQIAECLCEQHQPTNLVEPSRSYYRWNPDKIQDVPFVTDSEEFNLVHLQSTADTQLLSQQRRPRFGDIYSIIPQAENLWKAAVQEWIKRKNLLPMAESSSTKSTVSLILRSHVKLWAFVGGPLPALKQYMPLDWQQDLPESVEATDVSADLRLTLSCTIAGSVKTMCLPLCDLLVADTQKGGSTIRWPMYAAIKAIRDDYSPEIEQVCWKENGGLTQPCKVLSLRLGSYEGDPTENATRGSLLDFAYQNEKGEWESQTLVIDFNASLAHDGGRKFELCTLGPDVSTFAS